VSAASEQVKVLSRRLADTDTARRQAEVDRDLDLRNMLANASVDLIREADPVVLRGLVASLMLQRTRTAELLDQASAALQVALGYADGKLGRGTDDSIDELAVCREVLRKLTEATS